MRKWCKRFTAATALVMLALAGALWVSLPRVASLVDENPETTAFIELRKRQAAETKKRFRVRWKWKKLNQISPYLRAAVVLSEDPKFWDHAGVDWEAIRDVAEESWDAKKFTRGGSTITQQLAKNLYLSPTRSLVRKLREFLIARRLEQTLEKNRILEIYLNVAEWGDGIFGAEAAARRWYGSSASSLRPEQAVRLAVALPNPFRRSPAVRSRKLDRKSVNLLIEMRRRGALSRDKYFQSRRALGLPSPKDTGAPAALAPQDTEKP